MNHIRKLISLLFVLIFLTNCSSSDTESKTLYAKSADWYIELAYDKVGGKFIETPRIRYTGKENPIKVNLDIAYSNNSFTSNGITDIEPLMNDSVPMTLPTRTSVNNWRNTKSIKLNWATKEKSENEESLTLSETKPTS